MIRRRKFLRSVAAGLWLPVAPAIVRAASLDAAFLAATRRDSLPPFTPLASWDFGDGENAPTDWTPEAAGFDYDFDLSGEEVLSVTSNGSSSVGPNSSAPGDLSEVWISTKLRVSGNPAAEAILVGVRDSGFTLMGRVSIKTDRTLIARTHSGATATGPTAAVSTAAWVYLKLRFKAASGGGGNAEIEAWLMTDPGSGWGASVSRPDGTPTNNTRRIGISVGAGAGAGWVVYFNQMAYHNADIPAYFYA